MKKRKYSTRQIFTAFCFALFVSLLTIGLGHWVLRGMTKMHRKEAENILYHYSDKIMLQMKGTLNEADALAQTALAMADTGEEWFEQAAAPLLEREEVRFAFLFKGDTMVRGLPGNEFDSLNGMELEEFSYIFTMAKVVKDIVIEGPAVMEFDPEDQEVFLFLQPIVKNNLYLGEVVVALESSYVLEQLGLDNLSDQGYDYELWRVEPQNGGKEVIAHTQAGIDFSQAEKIAFYLPTQWNLSIQPRAGWLSPAQRGGLIAVCLALAVLILTIALLIMHSYQLRLRLKQMGLRDKKTGLYNQKGFTEGLERWLSGGESEITLFYFSIEGYGQAARRIGLAEEAEYLNAIAGRLAAYIHSSYLAGRVGEGNFLIAIHEKMDERQRKAFAKGLALELLLKFRLDGQKVFLMPQFQYRCCPRGSEAKTEIMRLIDEYYTRISQESPVKMLTEKCRQLIEGKEDVVFDEYTNPDMLELSKTFNRYRKQVEQLAYFDSVFSVGNRLKFFRDVNMLISYDKKRSFNLYCIDICNFSQYNELFSADVGDAILHEVRGRLSRHFGSNLYRINGDVFLGISLSGERMESFANRLLEIFRLPVVVKHFSFPLRVRIAACCYPIHGENSSVLIDRIQSALRFAKESDQNVVIYNQKLDELIRTEADILRCLKDAIEQETLEVWYQPIMLLETGNYSAVEALVRLSDGKNGYFSAAQVISLAERNGIVEQLGDYVLTHACSFMKARGEKLGLLRIGVNLSVQQLLIGNSAVHIKNLIQNAGIKTEQVTLEITESILIQSMDQAAETLEDLRRDGIHIALDDFGVGYSSLNYLSNLPVDIIKIDRSLTKQILTNFKQHTLLKAIVDLASTNGLAVVAEGVETESEQQIIAVSGVQYIQGYYYARPMPEEELIQFLK